jgi:hypothetical protein
VPSPAVTRAPSGHCSSGRAPRPPSGPVNRRSSRWPGRVATEFAAVSFSGCRSAHVAHAPWVEGARGR